MKIKSILMTTFLLVFFLFACQNNFEYQKVSDTRLAMGTIVQITVLDSSAKQGQAAIDSAFKEINRVASLFYEGNPQSPLYQFNQPQVSALKMPREVLKLIARSRQISQKTEGTFDMAVGRLLSLYNFKDKNPKFPEAVAIQQARQFIGYKHLHINWEEGKLLSDEPGLQLATGGIVKGYAVDRAISILQEQNVAGALVNAGGDMRPLPRFDQKQWTVGIRHPRKTNKVLYILEISDKAVTTSGDYEKYFMHKGQRIHHILDPRTGYPADSCQSVTVIAPRAELADALATGMFVAGPTRGQILIQQFPDCEALWIDKNGREFMTPGFKNYIFK